jgi:hypothetical protein
MINIRQRQLKVFAAYMTADGLACSSVAPSASST